MSDYRYSIMQHNGIESLYVLIDGEDGETHIPIADILASLQKQQAKHDGNLDTRNAGDELHAEVALRPDYINFTNNKRVYMHGGYGDCENCAMYLDPSQALSLLTWLQQEEATLKKLAEEHANG